MLRLQVKFQRKYPLGFNIAQRLDLIKLRKNKLNLQMYVSLGIQMLGCKVSQIQYFKLLQNELINDLKIKGVKFPSLAQLVERLTVE